ncbi:hypothetical protein SKAU_G00154530 [Synaphobranchus kaupii]|uniref:Uncharacterized protein n=1 Tax=Synaphobranchus kaupii TaxID=118154 RepID=A0A9Q1FHA1_SYNKA|nr:hypothetical protein SKAU_G00154530 [Synaphobranchus kaupii]
MRSQLDPELSLNPSCAQRSRRCLPLSRLTAWWKRLVETVDAAKPAGRPRPSFEGLAVKPSYGRLWRTAYPTLDLSLLERNRPYVKHCGLPWTQYGSIDLAWL